MYMSGPRGKSYQDTLIRVIHMFSIGAYKRDFESSQKIKVKGQGFRVKGLGFRI